jgi:hypothetical protein
MARSGTLRRDINHEAFVRVSAKAVRACTTVAARAALAICLDGLVDVQDDWDRFQQFDSEWSNVDVDAAIQLVKQERLTVDNCLRRPEADQREAA